MGALICGIGGFLGGISSIPAVVLGHRAKAEIQRTNEDGDGMATAGLVLGWIGIVWWGFLWFMTLVMSVQ